MQAHSKDQENEFPKTEAKIHESRLNNVLFLTDVTVLSRGSTRKLGQSPLRLRSLLKQCASWWHPHHWKISSIDEHRAASEAN